MQFCEKYFFKKAKFDHVYSHHALPKNHQSSSITPKCMTYRGTAYINILNRKKVHNPDIQHPVTLYVIKGSFFFMHKFYFLRSFRVQHKNLSIPSCLNHISTNNL